MQLLNILLQSLTEANILVFGTFAIGVACLVIVGLLFFNQRRTFYFQKQIQALENKQTNLVLHASLEVEEQQKTKLAANLHDDVGPTLAAIKLFLPKSFINHTREQEIGIIASAKDLVDQTAIMIRNISHELSPPALSKFGLASAIQEQFKSINKAGEIQVEANFVNYNRKLTSERETHTYRLIQELLKNIFTHSNATTINLTQNAENEYCYFRIDHNGTGLTQAAFDTNVMQSKGLGLKNILGRIKVLEATLRFDYDQDKDLFKTVILIPYINTSIAETIIQ